MQDPASYEAWYEKPKGAWAAEREWRMLLAMVANSSGPRALDVGCGTGHFTRRMATVGMAVTGLDPDDAALRFTRDQGGSIDYVRGDARQLPFADEGFDICFAITSLCFVDPPEQALAEMARVSRKAVILGLLGRPSLLHRRKRGRGGYAGARWDHRTDVKHWLTAVPELKLVNIRWALFAPLDSPLAGSDPGKHHPFMAAAGWIHGCAP